MVTLIYPDYTSVFQGAGFVILVTYISSSGTVKLSTANACNKLSSKVIKCFLV